MLTVEEQDLKIARKLKDLGASIIWHYGPGTHCFIIPGDPDWRYIPAFYFSFLPDGGFWSIDHLIHECEERCK